jgi:hypothetical protein
LPILVSDLADSSDLADWRASCSLVSILLSLVSILLSLVSILPNRIIIKTQQEHTMTKQDIIDTAIFAGFIVALGALGCAFF